MRNMKSIVNSNNRKIIQEEPKETEQKCNCPRNKTCPLNGNCLSRNTIYLGKVTSDLPDYGENKYAGLSEPVMKKRLGNHNLSFRDRTYAKCEIAKEVWRINDRGGNYNIEWEIVGHAASYNPITKKCHLCLSEMLYINENVDNLLNTRKELVQKCRHRNKFALVPKKSPDD